MKRISDEQARVAAGLWLKGFDTGMLARFLSRNDPDSGIPESAVYNTMSHIIAIVRRLKDERARSPFKAERIEADGLGEWPDRGNANDDHEGGPCRWALRLPGAWRPASQLPGSE